MKNLKKLTLLHSNDLHGDFLAERIDNKLVGGVSMLSGYINKVRAEEENVIYCIAGDMFRGSVIDAEYKGVSTIEIMNLLGPDVVTITIATAAKIPASTMADVLRITGYPPLWIYFFNILLYYINR
jgi:hypothetical protein